MRNLSKISLALLCLILAVRCGSDDPIPEKELPKLSINDGVGEEGFDLIFTVTLSEKSTDDVTFKYKTTNVTTSDGDLEVVSSPTLVTIAAGTTTAEITVALNTDTEDESSEKFKVVLSDPTNAELSSDAEGLGTINNVMAFFMKAKIDGVQWIARQDDFFYPEFFDHSFAGYGTGSFFDTQLSFVFFESPTGPRSYEYDPNGASDGDHVGAYYSPTFFSSGLLGPTYYGQAGGVFELTKYDLTTYVAEGTFHFSAKGEDEQVYQITEGSFRIKIYHE